MSLSLFQATARFSRLREPIEHRAQRLWFGPGEGPRDPVWKNWAVDGYGPYLWITEWESGERGSEGASEVASDATLSEVGEQSRQVYSKLGYVGAVVLRRPKQGVPALPVLLWGEVPDAVFEVREGNLRFQIRMLGSRHPGLFLDHRPLRDWLVGSGECRGRRVLNAFAYTGSLSVAAAAGGAVHVTTQDLSKATLQWDADNARINGILESETRFLAGDFFEEIPRLKRRGEKFGLILSDPPSFSRGKKGNFSTQRDLEHLHECLLSVLEPGGILVTSINSANVSWSKYEAEVGQAARRLGIRLEEIQRIEQPESFPWSASEPRSRYLKGFILRARSENA